SNRAGADQFLLLTPRTPAAGKHPRRARGATIVVIPTSDDGVAVAGQRDGVALRSGANRASADQLLLLAPRPAAAGEHPSGAAKIFTDGAAPASSFAAAGKPAPVPLLGGSHVAAADQLATLLLELCQRRLRRPKQQRSAQQRRHAKRHASRITMNVHNCHV